MQTLREHSENSEFRFLGELFDQFYFDSVSPKAEVKMLVLVRVILMTNVWVAVPVVAIKPF